MNICDQFSRVAKKIAEKEGIKNEILEFQYSGIKDAGYSGEIQALKLKGDNGKSLELIFKKAHTDEKLRDSIFNRDIYLQEICFYEECVPSMQKLQEEYQVEEPFDNFPKCYFTVKEPMEELLVLEDLKASNYDMWSPKNLSIGAHLKMALRTFGKFQATAMALKVKKPEEFARLKKLLQGERRQEPDLFTFLMEETKQFDMLEKSAQELVDMFDETTEKPYYEKYKKFAHSLKQHFLEAIIQQEHEVFSQGDSWCNNMMFQYADKDHKEEPINMKLIDFQLVYTKPALLDVAFVIYGSASKKELDDLEEYLKIYHDALGMQLAKFMIDVNDLMPFDELVKSWGKYALYGLCWIPFIRKVVLTEADEAPDMQKLTNEGVNASEAFTYKLRKDEEYRRQIKEIAVHFIDKNYI